MLLREVQLHERDVKRRLFEQCTVQERAGAVFTWGSGLHGRLGYEARQGFGGLFFAKRLL